MARYTGPMHKLCRREGIPLCDSPKCPARGKRKYPPGQHGPTKGYPRGQSIYSKQLRAKQRVKRLYGMLENQFRRFFEMAKQLKGNTGENLLKLLESRLDNAVYRVGLADTRRQARQLVTHAHIMINGKKINVPSYIIKAEDLITVAPRAVKTKYFDERLAVVGKKDRPAWLAWDDTKKVAKVVSEPDIRDLIESLAPKMIVELYSK
ncbi:MAG: 30S ribosomal protein S4 [Candidatus Jacksonbacteria bacterium RIFOXYC2_FULL_44_29]|nr:MAG: 30S ribosomal protein S4 [Candidatus Jacksonbacteria bacterium RIFOXYA2_FULL_43_12]OGY76803.1 MAG: 30S ribosomal protein S4 [Candidatus Jacksonbacteria bacterium RIFOXYB2_FULL_44_15]OGY79208.1 MAG: 30S ribosomal protein S4 [Candidatus Jacksonbacteria bacterium RIFOXYC2_FULL_44_29]OGY82125.1 MAG: 30S ribosomal protein S4 [Candidatus Jacksonbacteria bacterium RIFOXYD2_FULL_43_21]HBH46898.1 30S ribosomal protein S4 [Candidatus Jacksonbacteria bacterium]